jgi:hypothetical protein
MKVNSGELSVRNAIMVSAFLFIMLFSFHYCLHCCSLYHIYLIILFLRYEMDIVTSLTSDMYVCMYACMYMYIHIYLFIYYFVVTVCCL